MSPPSNNTISTGNAGLVLAVLSFEILIIIDTIICINCKLLLLAAGFFKNFWYTFGEISVNDIVI